MISQAQALVTDNTRRMTARSLGQAKGPPACCLSPLAPSQDIHLPFPVHSCGGEGLSLG